MLKRSLFTLALFFSMNAFAATGTGHAQAELSTPLTVTNVQDVRFGTIAIDPAAGAQTISQPAIAGAVVCPATYVCSGINGPGSIQVTGAAATINISLEGSTATLSDGSGNTLIFDPILNNGTDTNSFFSPGSASFSVGGSIDFTGSEVAGTYNTTNTGGSGYTVTVNY